MVLWQKNKNMET